MSNTKDTGANEGKSQEQLKKEKLKPTEEEDYGYYFYPDRDTRSKVDENKSFLSKKWEKFMRSGYSGDSGDQLKCESNVIWCKENDSQVKLMLAALKSKGCEINLGRHISCEPCRERCNGGYDPNSNQIVVCQNNTRKKDVCCSVLAHELTHAYDNCRAKVDFTDIEQVACTEIRASNFTHCSLATSMMNGEASPWNYKEAHQLCVKNKALHSVLLVRNVTMDEAATVVDKVFDKCYADLEPVGRIPRKYTRDAYLSFIEGRTHGYFDKDS
ncbi:mitochondrial inner membrane protease ATP23 homolog [Mytilus trossulus]|uniref:mitochondrial inner membrane protease ATP23 homolog n=1 Tax=Mytilus trossulus TaxID=6551 RepID=UPI003004B19A